MTPILLSTINEIINWEFTLSLMEINEMNHCHEMGLQGYKRFHRFWACDRHRHATMLCNHLVEYQHTIPNITISYSSNGTSSSSLLESLQKMYDACKIQLNRLKNAAKLAIDEGEDFLMDMIEKMVKDQSMECERYYREILELRFTNSDRTFIACHSEKLHCKYKEKEMKYFHYEDKPYGGNK